MKKDFWRGRRVFLTGHTGFKGGWMALWLESLGAIVAGYSLEPSTDPSLFDIASVARAVDQEWMADIRNLQNLSIAIDSFCPDIIFHMAAQPLVRQSYSDPIETYETNVLGTINVLQAARDIESLEAIVVITTDKCYENLEINRPYKENDAMGGYDPYSSSKACAELATASFARSFFSESHCAIATARAGNVIGGGDWSKDRLIVDIMRGLIKGAPIEIRNPGSVRPWQHVLDPINGYLTLAEYLVENKVREFEGWNFGPSHEGQKTVSQITQLVSRHWPGGNFHVSQAAGPHEAGLLTLDSTKAHTVLKWAPQLEIDESIAQTVFWYKAFADQSDMKNFTLKQIQDFETRLP